MHRQTRLKSKHKKQEENDTNLRHNQIVRKPVMKIRYFLKSEGKTTLCIEGRWYIQQQVSHPKLCNWETVEWHQQNIEGKKPVNLELNIQQKIPLILNGQSSNYFRFTNADRILHWQTHTSRNVKGYHSDRWIMMTDGDRDLTTEWTIYASYMILYTYMNIYDFSYDFNF